MHSLQSFSLSFKPSHSLTFEPLSPTMAAYDHWQWSSFPHSHFSFFFSLWLFSLKPQLQLAYTSMVEYHGLSHSITMIHHEKDLTDSMAEPFLLSLSLFIYFVVSLCLICVFGCLIFCLRCRDFEILFGI